MFPIMDLDNISTEIIEEIEQTSSTSLGRVFKLDYTNQKAVVQIVNGKPVDAISTSEKVQEYVKILLRTQLGKYKVYKDTTFGMTYFNYLGHRDVNIGLIKSEFKREIIEKIEQLKEVDSVDNFNMELNNTTLQVNFKINLADGNSADIAESVVI